MHIQKLNQGSDSFLSADQTTKTIQLIDLIVICGRQGTEVLRERHDYHISDE